MSVRGLFILGALATALAACGGGGSVADANTGGGSTDSDTSTGSSGASVSAALGSGTGADFEEGAITLSADYALVGGNITVSVDGVDTNSTNEALTDSYRYTFAAACSSAEFSITSTYSTTNSVSSVYRNKGCADGDTITVSMYNGDTGSLIDTATATIETDYPALGTGSGASFIEGELDGDLEVTDDEGTELSVNLVNPLDSNALITDTGYVARWFSDCDDGSFTIARATNSSGTFDNQYLADYSSCAGDNTVTVLVSGSDTSSCSLADTSGCYAVLTETIEVTLGEDPQLGVIVDDAFYSELLVNGVRESEYGDSPTSASVDDSLKLSAGGTMLIKANIVDANDSDAQISGTTYGVTLESSCVEDGTATLDEEEKTTTNGEVRFTYTAAGCLSDSFSAYLYTVVDGELTTRINSEAITGIIFIQSAEVGGISFDSVSEAYLSLKDIGDPVLPKQSVVTFTVVDQQGEPVEGQEVDFSLNNTTGGITLGSGLTTDTDVTDSSGQVTVIVNSGSSHAVTSVRATTLSGSGVEISTNSQPITITTGIADQDSFDIAVDVFNPRAYDFNGTEVSVTVYAADQYQNPVADGTTVNFTAESGTIESSCETSGGTCSVTWYSSGTRPGNHATSLHRVNELYPVDDPSTTDDETLNTILGMTTITAYSIGEGGYTDTNGNGLFDVLTSGDPEPFVGLAEAFRDDNWNGAVDTYNSAPVEFFADFDSDEVYDDTESTVYQGVTCSDSAVALGHCANLAHVRQSIRIIQSDSNVVMRLYTSADGVNFTEVDDITLGVSGTFYVLLQDGNGNFPASGTSLALSGSGYDVFGSSGDVGNSLGYLLEEDSSYTGLPTFGRLYNVSYTAEDEPENIEITASGDEASLTVRLTP
ncbi:hypothetical protein [Oceanobacter mangrovi]|uniref:hypothetical protein n=1 Tax=Oceanobacter mangrovi TaxID=2862510 RepID=UPI001C8D2887|nr:hypothetical protein [Oceanobacter mangrovi]